MYRLFQHISRGVFVAATTTTCTSNIAQPADTCAERVATVDKLRLRDGRTVYIEPQAVASSNRSLVLLGEPVYAWTRREGEFRLDAGADIVGARLTPADTLPVPRPPVPGILTYFRILEDGDDYAVVFAVTDSSSVGAYTPSVRSYWYGRTDGRTWRSIEQLPMPRAPLLASRATQLVRTGEELIIAAPYGAGTEHHAAVFTRTPAGWRLDTIPMVNVAYLALAAQGTRLFMYAVHPDTAKPPDINSLWLLQRVDAEWHARGLLIRGGSSPLHLPRVATHAAGQLLSWTQHRDGARTARVANIGPDGSLDDERIMALRVEDASPANRTSGQASWVVSHRSASAARITLIEPSRHSALVRDAVTNPYTGLFIAAAADDARIAIGPLFDPTSKEEPLVSGILRFTSRCAYRVSQEAP